MRWDLVLPGRYECIRQITSAQEWLSLQAAEFKSYKLADRERWNNYFWENRLHCQYAAEKQKTSHITI